MKKSVRERECALLLEGTDEVVLCHVKIVVQDDRTVSLDSQVPNTCPVVSGQLFYQVRHSCLVNLTITPTALLSPVRSEYLSKKLISLASRCQSSELIGRSCKLLPDPGVYPCVTNHK